MARTPCAMLSGPRVCSGITPTPSSMRRVSPAAWASAASPSIDPGWLTQNELYPRASASRAACADDVGGASPANSANPVSHSPASSRGLPSSTIHREARRMNHPSAGHTRILVWMCVLIAVNQLGFGSVDAGARALRALVRRRRSRRSAWPSRSTASPASSSRVPAGQLADRVGRRGALALGGLVTAAGNLLCAYAPTLPGVRRRALHRRRGRRAGASSPARSCSPTSPRRRTAAGRWRSTRASSSSRSASDRCPAACSPSASGLAAPFVVYAAPASWPPRSAGSASPRRETIGAREWRADAATRAAAVRRADPPAHRPARLRAGEPRRLRQRGGAHRRALQHHPHAGARPARADADRIGVGLALASLVGLAFAYPVRHAGGPLRPQDRDRPGDADVGRRARRCSWSRPPTPGSSPRAWCGAWPPA